MSKVSRPAFAVGAISVLLVLALVIAIILDFPVTENIGYRCPYCGARYSQLKMCGLTASKSINETELSKYVARHVDPHHKHCWVRSCKNNNLGFGGHGDGRGWDHPRWLLQDDAALAVLKSLPSPGARERFLKQMWGSGIHRPKSENEMLTLSAYKLREAYLEYPNRKDWLKILKKNDFKP